MDRPHIRSATAGDVHAIAALHLASWRTAYRGIVPDAFLNGVTIDSRIERWTRAVTAPAVQRVTTLVATSEQAVIGVSSFGPGRDHESSGEIYALHVLPGHTRRGVGAALFNQSTRMLRHMGFASVTLWVLRDNQAARLFY
ncbi:MAG: GNAT family N-acetyltransferase, partial [Candidatus Dormibacteraeota bacterium]|nr:GNAT family N-acetyltransferase [Candidatus Dormibacteraeota bacterium]